MICGVRFGCFEWVSRFHHSNAKCELITPSLKGLSAGEGRPSQIKSRKTKTWIHESWNGIHKILLYLIHDAKQKGSRQYDPRGTQGIV